MVLAHRNNGPRVLVNCFYSAILRILQSAGRHVSPLEHTVLIPSQHVLEQWRNYILGPQSDPGILLKDWKINRKLLFNLKVVSNF